MSDSDIKKPESASSPNAVEGCLTRADGSKRSVVIHYEYDLKAKGDAEVISTRYTEADGETVITLGLGEAITVGACLIQVDRTVEFIRGSDVLNLAAPYRSFSVTAYSTDVELNGQAIKAGQSVSIDTNQNESYATNVTIAGTDYYLTVTR